MINNIKRKYLNIIILLIIGIIYTFTLKYIFDIIDVYDDWVLYILIIIYLLFSISVYFKKILYCKILYYISGYNFNFYLIDWMKYFFNNKIILINTLGNILLFIPMGLFNKKIVYSFFVIILIEFFQLLLKKGIFDIVDIVLNLIGVIFGFLGVFLWKKIKTKKRK